MLNKAHRFSFKKGAPRRIFSTPLFVLRYDQTDNGGLHCAVVVGKKVDKRAVIRNKIKRQLIEIIQSLVSKDINYEIVLFAKKQIGAVEKEEIYKELDKAFKQLKITT